MTTERSTTTTERPTTLLAELTHRCPLHCPYCSNPLDLLRADQEIGTDDWKRVFTEARELGVLQLGLSGGEPLVRKDLEELAVHARSLGLYTTLVTSGLGLTRKRAEALRAAGLEHIQVSVQDADPEIAERIAGVSGIQIGPWGEQSLRGLGEAQHSIERRDAGDVGLLGDETTALVEEAARAQVGKRRSGPGGAGGERRLGPIRRGASENGRHCAHQKGESGHQGSGNAPKIHRSLRGYRSEPVQSILFR